MLTDPEALQTEMGARVEGERDPHWEREDVVRYDVEHCAKVLPSYERTKLSAGERKAGD